MAACGALDYRASRSIADLWASEQNGPEQIALEVVMDIGPYVALAAMAIGIAITAHRRQWWFAAICAINGAAIASRQVFNGGAVAELLTWIGIGAFAVAAYQAWRQRPKSQLQR